MNATAPREYIPLSTQRRNVLFVALDGAAIGLMSAAATFISVFAIRLGASALWVSLISSIPSAVGLVMAIPWSTYAERQARPQALFARARLIIHAVYPAIAAVPFVLQGEQAAIAVVILWSLAAFPGSLSNMMFTVVMGRAVAPERRAFLMSRRWTFLGIAKLVSLPLVSQLIERVAFPLGYQIAFGANFAIALLAFYCASQLRVPERHRPSRRTKLPLRERIRQSLANIVRERPFLVFVSGRAMLNLGLALVSAIIPIYWVNYLHASESWIGYFAAALSAATLISYAAWVRIKRKLGTWKTLIASVLSSALYPALLSLTRTPVAVLPVMALNGLAAGGINLAFFDALFDTCPRDKEERFVAINMIAINLMGVVAPPIGAALLNVLSIRWVLVVGTIVALSGAGVFALARAGTGPASVAAPPAEREVS